MCVCWQNGTEFWNHRLARNDSEAEQLEHQALHRLKLQHKPLPSPTIYINTESFLIAHVGGGARDIVPWLNTLWSA